MKFVVFSDKSADPTKLKAESFKKLLEREGCQVIAYGNGVWWLNKPNLLKIFIKDAVHFFMNIKSKNRKLYIYRFFSLLTFNSKKRKKEMSECDCMVVTYSSPPAFDRRFMSRIELLREKYKKPIVNYDVHYLPTQGWWKNLKEQDNANFGLERFDWYLPAAIVSHFALQKNIPTIYSHIGMDINSANLYPEQNDFIALVDFVHKGFEKEREMQIQALKETNTHYIELQGRYTTEEIRNIYRKCSMHFLTWFESFGLPIVELQLCGCAIFMPDKKWVPAHFLNKSIYDRGEGDLGSNFYVYNNDINLLKIQIEQLKLNYSSKKIIDNFKKEYPLYYQGDSGQIRDFLNKLQSGEINMEKHKEFEKYNEYISLNDDILIFYGI
jgi:hypothetical protein